MKQNSKSTLSPNPIGVEKMAKGDKFIRFTMPIELEVPLLEEETYEEAMVRAQRLAEEDPDFYETILNLGVPREEDIGFKIFVNVGGDKNGEG